eukprot:TRINITY_DN4847_c0_g1_i1.p1 TRINITY_DN4847_c0_g1~~TRINITY_DN4847_c0_g1_i1.p1  ORF type:complete len:600 (+),score=198.28 TRINITY_DN4847_c0_g1_i1:83-1801(+)
MTSNETQKLHSDTSEALLSKLRDASARLRGSADAASIAKDSVHRDSASEASIASFQHEAFAVANAVDEVVEGFSSLVSNLLLHVRSLESTVQTIAASTRSRPSHFVGLRMPPIVRARLEKLQAAFLRRWPKLKKAAVHAHKVHVTLMVTKVEPERLEAAREALEVATSLWRAEQIHRDVKLQLAGLEHFDHNGVLFAKLQPEPPLQSLRSHLAKAFFTRGFQVDQDVEDELLGNDKVQGKAKGKSKGSKGKASKDAKGVSRGAVWRPKVTDEAQDAESNEDDGSHHGEDEDASEEAGETDEETSEKAADTDEGCHSPSSPSGNNRKGFHPHVTLFKASQAGHGGRTKDRRKEEKLAKKAVLLAAKSIAASAKEQKEQLIFGSLRPELCEFMDMRGTQSDGYYEVQATAALTEECLLLPKGDGQDLQETNHEIETERYREACKDLPEKAFNDDEEKAFVETLDVLFPKALEIQKEEGDGDGEDEEEEGGGKVRSRSPLRKEESGKAKKKKKQKQTKAKAKAKAKALREEEEDESEEEEEVSSSRKGARSFYSGTRSTCHAKSYYSGFFQTKTS